DPIFDFAGAGDPGTLPRETGGVMAKPSPTYRGDAPYVFVCYAHANMDEVYAEIEWLQACGINVWYDEGISAGAEWREELGDAIRDCHLFLFFVSPEATRSPNCRRELNFALDHERPTLAVYLSETEMSSGLYLSLADRQAILRYAETDADYRDKLLDSVSRALGVEVPVAAGPVHRAPRRSAGRWRQWASVAAIALIVGGLGWYLGSSDPEQSGSSTARLTRFQIDTPDGPITDVAVAPDGSSVAYIHGTSVFVRALDALEARTVPGGPEPLYSPDGKWIVSRGDQGIMRVPVEGGPPISILETSQARPLGACTRSKAPTGSGSCIGGLWRARSCVCPWKAAHPV
ncbi:MAG: TIR domain-containing protein, partial [Gammaproteobacteria bacterium]